MKIVRRCRARLPKERFRPYYGRCDLPRDHDGEHVLERGMDRVLFTIRTTARTVRQEPPPPPPPPA